MQKQGRAGEGDRINIDSSSAHSISISMACRGLHVYFEASSHLEEKKSKYKKLRHDRGGEEEGIICSCRVERV